MLDLGSALARQASAVLDIGSAMPRQVGAVLDVGSAMPRQVGALLDVGSAIPRQVDAMLDVGSAPPRQVAAMLTSRSPLLDLGIAMPRLIPQSETGGRSGGGLPLQQRPQHRQRVEAQHGADVLARGLGDAGAGSVHDGAEQGDGDDALG